MASWAVLKSGAGSVAKVTLRRGACVKAEPDALITMSQMIELGAQMDAGLFSGLMRSALGGESLFSQTLTARSGDGDVVLSRIRREWVDRLDLCNPLDSDAWM